MDELIFSGKYGSWELSARFDLDGASPEDVACALAYLHEQIEGEAFCHSGIECDKIEAMVPEGKGIGAAAKFIGSMKSGQWKELMVKYAVKPELAPVAESKLICSLLKKFGLHACVTSGMACSKIKPAAQEPLEGQIALICRYKDWIAIKKMGVDETTKDYEVAGILSAINTTLVRKAFDFVEVDRGAEAVADELTRGMRKSFQNLATALAGAEPKAREDPIYNALLMKKILENLGFPPYANVESMIKAYPELKTAKPRGRVAKK
jgi:hypothetical protein